VLIGLPLRRERGAAPDDSAGDALRHRLAEIERDRAGGLIDIGSAAEAEIEAKRAAIREGANDGVPRNKARRLRLAAVAFLGAAPLAAVGLYLRVGAPALINPPPIAAAADIAALPEEDRRAMIEQMVGGLAARLEAEPNDAEGWRMLARSQMVLERPADSAASYKRLLTFQEGSLEDWRNYATALAATAPEKRFPAEPEFLRALGEIEKRAPGDMMALFYRGGAAREAGDAAGAAELWRRLLSSMPADAPVRATLEALIIEADAAALTNAVPK
jgi:cytochrome c-type biogenesis protein CcmH